jgi:hypothetical protein
VSSRGEERLRDPDHGNAELPVHEGIESGRAVRFAIEFEFEFDHSHSPVSFEWKESIMALEQPSGRYKGFFPADGIDVIEKGLPPLPEVITHELMVPIPISYWVASDSAIVVFFYFSELPGRGIQPFVSIIPYYKKSGKWSVKTYSNFTGSGFPFDPVTESERIDDLDGSHLVNSSVGKKQAEGEPLMWVATGHASRDVAYVALVQAGTEERRRLDSHFGTWVVCTQVREPFDVVAFDNSGQELSRIHYPPGPGILRDFP